MPVCCIAIRGGTACSWCSGCCYCPEYYKVGKAESKARIYWKASQSQAKTMVKGFGDQDLDLDTLESKFRQTRFPLSVKDFVPHCSNFAAFFSIICACNQRFSRRQVLADD
jgi:hypothetical protein